MARIKRLNKVTGVIISKKSSKKKKKLALGDTLRENPEPIGQGLNLAGSVVEGLAPEDSMGGGIAGGALKGAGTLAAAGPAGMAVGAVVGGTMGAINAKKIQKEQEEQLSIRSNAIQRSLMKYNKGGKMSPTDLKVLEGGGLIPISEDAVEVKANNPNQTDSVELEEAFVDHNEIIDNQNRVFSDELKMPDGKSIAKHAKKLEKMKNDKTRFKDSNSLVDSKLDKLFAYQEAKKNKAVKGKLKKGGKLSYELGGEPDPKNATAMRAYIDAELRKNYPGIPLEQLDQHNKPIIPGVMDTVEQAAIRKGYLPSTNEVNLTPQFEQTIAKVGGGMAKGGRLGKRKINNALEAGISAEDRMRPDQIQSTGKSGFNTNSDNLLTNVATFAPNIVSTALQSRLKGPASPQLESGVKLKRISPTAQLAELNRQTGAVSETINKNTAQSADLIAGQGSLLAKKLNAQNNIYGQVNSENARIGSQEAYLNQGTKARNAGRLNQFMSDSVDFSNAKKRLTSENVANLSGKVLSQGREKNLMDKDKLALEVLAKSYGDSGVYQRNLDELLEKYLTKKTKNKKGGKLYSKRKSK